MELNKNSDENKNNKLLIILISLMIIIAVIIIAYFLTINFSIEKTTNKTTPNLNDCIKNKSTTTECQEIYSNSDIISDCSKLEESKESCFYITATYKNDKTLCEYIENQEKREECKNSISLSNPYFINEQIELQYE